MKELQEKLDVGKEEYEKEMADLKFKVDELESANADLGKTQKIEVEKADQEAQTEMLLSTIDELESTMAGLKERLRESEEMIAYYKANKNDSRTSSKK